MAIDVRDDLIEGRIAELSARLDGSRRAKADILREVRHGLTDTAGAYREEGMSPEEATHTALAEFGDPAELAPEFQMELASRQTRLALGFLAASGPVTEVLSRIQWSNSPVRVAEPPPEYTFVLAWLLDVQAWAMSLAAVGVLLVMGFGVRRLTFGVRLAQVVAVGIVTKVVTASVMGMVVMSLFGVPIVSADAAGIAMGVLYPASAVYLMWLAWRCSRTASYAHRLAVV